MSLLSKVKCALFEDGRALTWDLVGARGEVRFTSVSTIAPLCDNVITTRCTIACRHKYDKSVLGVLHFSSIVEQKLKILTQGGLKSRTDRGTDFFSLYKSWSKSRESLGFYVTLARTFLI